MERLNSERIKEYLRNDLERSQHWSDVMWKSTMAKGGGNKKKFNTVMIHQDKKFFISELFKGHSGRNLVDSSLQEHVLIPSDFFEYIYHIGCTINLHSIMNSGLIPGGKNLSKRQTVFFTSVDPMNKEHEDPDEINLHALSLAWYKQKCMEENIKTRCIGLTSSLLQRKDF